MPIIFCPSTTATPCLACDQSHDRFRQAWLRSHASNGHVRSTPEFAPEGQVVCPCAILDRWESPSGQRSSQRSYGHSQFVSQSLDSTSPTTDHRRPLVQIHEPCGMERHSRGKEAGALLTPFIVRRPIGISHLQQRLLDQLKGKGPRQIGLNATLAVVAANGPWMSLGSN